VEKVRYEGDIECDPSGEPVKEGRRNGGDGEGGSTRGA